MARRFRLAGWQDGAHCPDAAARQGRSWAGGPQAHTRTPVPRQCHLWPLQECGGLAPPAPWGLLGGTAGKSQLGPWAVKRRPAAPGQPQPLLTCCTSPAPSVSQIRPPPPGCQLDNGINDKGRKRDSSRRGCSAGPRRARGASWRPWWWPWPGPSPFPRSCRLAQSHGPAPPVDWEAQRSAGHRRAGHHLSCLSCSEPNTVAPAPGTAEKVPSHSY